MSIQFFRYLSVPFLVVALLAACNNVNNSIKTVSAKSDSLAGEGTKPISSATPQPPTAKGEQTAVFAGGCFWGVEGVFEHIKGVSDVKSGFAGGAEEKKGYAEAVKITYDSSKVSYDQLLKIFFLVAHDPTELDRQGPDVGAQYRSAIFYASEEQKRLAERYIAELTTAKTFAQPIVTEIAALDTFKQAGNEHQDYMARHPDDVYIVTNDKPKLENLRGQFPDLYESK